MTKRHLIIATRESPLALRQAEMIKAQLQAVHPNLTVEFLGMTTKADRMLDKKVIDIGGKGAFVKELEEALLQGRADIAVHSMKDVPMDLPPGLSLPVITAREDVRDAFVSLQFHSVDQLPHNARVGTSSLRRQTQLLAHRPDLMLVDVRGNLQTRLKKLSEGAFDALILASAGLKRMGLQDHIKEYLPVQQSLPAAGQGALGIECRADDLATQHLIQVLNDATTAACVTAERALCRRLGGGCHVPVAAYAHLEHGDLILHGLVAAPRGKKILRSRQQGSIDVADSLGLAAAEALRLQGAEKILKEYV